MAHRRDILTTIGAGTLFTTGVTPVMGTSQQDGGNATGIFMAAMTGDQEVPAVETQAEGSAVFSVDQNDNVQYAVLVTNIENVNQAHIHQGQAGENGDIVQWLYPGPEPNQQPQVLSGRFDGVLRRGSFSANDLIGPLEGESIDALVQLFQEGNAYTNVHTEQNPEGEIRGQIRPLSAFVES